ncbi:phosphatidylserine/phosphatidylglycerophosphate/cardiolipin synthase family protein [Sphingomonas sp.]|uniref:phospholipase D-like domain-containing protein n=1 Tax=Sphingomonas sp. TaxID=28214 RepID=UPI0025E8CBCF|nr:phosphatidylserine/phosphatidylglycerophosphate/cardiolipin synthase family protein [Sphingomonas sp.]MBV9528964.1 phosphatidylserine/phosphatidylglycerophosphate/cardiolipin synthase family protein [Sphingomonas sp.]
MADGHRSLTIDGNRLTLLPDGPERFVRLLELIDGARQSLRLLYYIYTADGSGEKVRDALLRAIDRGVAVSLLIDGFGSSHTPETYFRELHERGARFCRFNPAYGRRYLLRNHQKLALADGETGEARVLIGGFNIADSYFADRAVGGWRDIGLMVEGPAAARLVPYYDALMTWSLAKGSRLKTLRAVVRNYSEHEGQLQWLFGGPMQLKSPWGIATLHDLAKARDLEMIVAYFAPLGGTLKRIGAVAARGRARVIIPCKSDNPPTVDAARSTYARLMKRRVQIFEYQPTNVHSKLLVMDDIVHIGSSNFDLRSLYLNMEMMLRVRDPDFAIMMRSYFEHELGDCLEITPELYRQRATWTQRLRWRIGWFLVTSLDYTVTRRLALRVP